MNVNTGEIARRTTLGVIDELEALGVKNTGALNLGGSIATASGLIFVGATSDGRFRAFESKSGKELWVRKLDASAYATPMTFMGKDGRQYVAIAAGGGGFFQTKPGRQLTVFALPVAPRATARATARAKAPATTGAAAPASTAPAATAPTLPPRPTP